MDRINHRASDEELAALAAGGDRRALEEVLERYAAWIHNLAWRMVGDPIEAEDLSQEAMIKVVTRLSTFRGESRFRTWLYSIVSRCALDLRRQPREGIFSSFAAHAAMLNTLEGPPDTRLRAADCGLMAEETRSVCLEGMLLCLDREQRLVFILGGLFNLPSDELSAVLDLSADAVRQRLSRARRELRGYMVGRCGLFEPPGPCRCSYKTVAAMRAGFIDPDRRVFTEERVRSVRDQVRRTGLELENLQSGDGLGVFLEEPFLEGRPSFLPVLIKRLSKEAEHHGRN